MRSEIEALANSVGVMLFMEGVPFEAKEHKSRMVSDLLMDAGCEFSYMDIRKNPEAEKVLSEMSGLAKPPFLFVDGKCVGDSKDVARAYDARELLQVIRPYREFAM